MLRDLREKVVFNERVSKWMLFKESQRKKRKKRERSEKSLGCVVLYQVLLTTLTMLHAWLW